MQCMLKPANTHINEPSTVEGHQEEYTRQGHACNDKAKQREYQKQTGTLTRISIPKIRVFGNNGESSTINIK